MSRHIKSIVLFISPGFPACDLARAFLRERGLKFEEVDVSRNWSGWEEMVGATGQKGVPVVKINEEYVVGFDRVKLGRMV